MKILKIIFIAICVFLCGTVNGSAQMTPDEALSEFFSAGIAYKDGRYDEAIQRYEKIYEGKRVNGPLYYNLGNSYFKKRNLGKAMLSYERARRYIPRDSDLNFNYRYVRSQIDQYVPEKSANILSRIFKSFIQFYTVDEMAIVLVCIVIVIGIIFLISLYVNWFGLMRAGVFTLLGLCFLVYGFGLIANVQQQRDMAVIMSSTESYFEPRSDSTVHFKLSEGMKARILKSEGHWVKIERVDGKVGWVDREVLVEI